MRERSLPGGLVAPAVLVVVFMLGIVVGDRSSSATGPFLLDQAPASVTLDSGTDAPPSRQDASTETQPTTSADHPQAPTSEAGPAAGRDSSPAETDAQADGSGESGETGGSAPTPAESETSNERGDSGASAPPAERETSTGAKGSEPPAPAPSIRELVAGTGFAWGEGSHFLVSRNGRFVLDFEALTRCASAPVIPRIPLTPAGTFAFQGVLEGRAGERFQVSVSGRFTDARTARGTLRFSTRNCDTGRVGWLARLT